MSSQHNWDKPFIGAPNLREVQDGIKIWDITMSPYPRELFHMGRLRYPTSNGWGTIEQSAAEMIVETKLSKKLSFKSNIPWRYYQNHFKEKPFDPTVKSIENFLQTNNLDRGKLRLILRKHKYNGMPDLLGRNGKKFDLWEIKAPLDNHRFEKSLSILKDLSKFGFNSNLLCIHEFGKLKGDLAKERAKTLNTAKKAYSELLRSSVGMKVLENIIKPTIKNTNDFNSVNYIFSKYESGVSYFVYALVYYIERLNVPLEYVKAFTLTQKEIIYLSRQLYLCGSYHWWRIPLLFMLTISDKRENEEYIELLREAIRWEDSFKTIQKNILIPDFENNENYFVEYYRNIALKKPIEVSYKSSRKRIENARNWRKSNPSWYPLYYSKPLR